MSLISTIKERHVNWGITISTIITSFIYVILSIISLIIGVAIYYGTVLYADLQFLFGSVVGIIYTLRNCQPEQSLLKYGVIVGIMGGVLSSVLISLYETLLLILAGRGNIGVFFLFLGFSLLSGAVIGLLTGAIIGTVYIYKEMKRETKIEKDDDLDEDFFQGLIDK